MINVGHRDIWESCTVIVGRGNNIGDVHCIVTCTCGWRWEGHVPVASIAYDVARGHETTVTTLSCFDLRDEKPTSNLVKWALHGIDRLDVTDAETVLADLDRAMVDLGEHETHATLGLLAERVNRRLASWSRLDAPDPSDP